MRFGFIVPHNYGIESVQDVVHIAVEAEEMGFDSVWVNHHILHAGYVLDRLGDRPYFEGLTVLTYLAALIGKARLGTSVLVLPYLNPIVLAKALATLDVLCDGRLTVGVGVGILRPESDALGSDFGTRGVYADESIAIMKELWTERDPSFNGRFFSFSGVKASPKPVQKPHPPILIGGNSRAALRRVARMGDGWHSNSTTPVETAGAVEYLKRQMDAAGRDMSEISITVRSELGVLDSAPTQPQEPMVGTPDQLLETIETFRSLGVSEIVLHVGATEPDRCRRVMEAFAEKVMPRAVG